jgi:hypothetical protein
MSVVDLCLTGSSGPGRNGLTAGGYAVTRARPDSGHGPLDGQSA